MTIPHIDGFEITAWVRETSTGTIWRATQLSLDRPVLLHILKSGVDADIREAFERNARLVAKINLPGLVGIYDVASSPEGQVFAILDAYEGQTLRDTLAANGPFSQKKLLPLARSIAETLDAAWQSHRYVHRNLKPEEIALLRDGSVRITDFASASYVDANGLLADRSGEVVGTPAYMPPEQAEARPTLDTHADMYALGAILYLLATGRAPFDEYAGDPMRLLQVLPFGTLPSPRDSNTSITPGFEAVLGRLLMKNPQDRYGSWGGLIQDLDAIAAGKPPAIAKAFVASGKPTLAPSVRYPNSVSNKTPTEVSDDESVTDRISRRERAASGTPAIAPVLWLVLFVAAGAFGAWRWKHPTATFADLRASYEARMEAKRAAREAEKAAKEADNKKADEEGLIPLAPLPQPQSPETVEPENLSVSNGSQQQPTAIDERAADSDRPQPAASDESTYEQTGISTVGQTDRQTDGQTDQPTGQPPAIPAYLRSFVSAVRAGSGADVLAALKQWNETNPEEAAAAAKTLQACDWPDDRLGSRLMDNYGKPLTFRFRQQDVTVSPESYVDGKLTGKFVQKDGTARSVTFPLSELDAKTRLALYRKCAPVGSSTEPENHAATALYALGAGDVAAFRAEIPLSSGLEPILWQISDIIEAREKAKTAEP